MSSWRWGTGGCVTIFVLRFFPDMATLRPATIITLVRLQILEANARAARAKHPQLMFLRPQEASDPDDTEQQIR